MASHPLLILKDIAEYHEHYKNNYCRDVITTFDGIRVYFSDQTFGHAFYRNSNNKNGPKDAFCRIRAERMDWIKITLASEDAVLFQGWNKHTKQHDQHRRVSVLLDDFIVVIEISMNKKGVLKGKFITCYVADVSIEKVRQSPLWDRESCIENLKENKVGR